MSPAEDDPPIVGIPQGIISSERMDELVPRLGVLTNVSPS